MNIRFLFSILFVCGVLSSVSAQRGPGMDDASREQRKERIEAMRVSYITSALELNVEESQSFWRGDARAEALPIHLFWRQ